MRTHSSEPTLTPKRRQKSRKPKKRRNRFDLFLTYLFVGMNLMNMAVMVCCAYSSFISPQYHPSVACLGLVFPVVALVNIAFIVFWLIFRAHLAWLPFVGFLLCAGPLYSYFPIHFSRTVPEETIKMLSYNTCAFANDTVPIEQSNMYAYFQEVDADIVCLQEASPHGKIQPFLDLVKPLYPHQVVTYVGEQQNPMMLLSKYPVLSYEVLPYESKGNGSTAYLLEIEGDTVCVINNHMESNRLTISDKERYRQMFNHIKRDTIVVNSKNVFGKVRNASALRAAEIDVVAEYVRNHSNYPMLVCGDFNDSPISYTYRTMAHLLTDSYAESGNGPGFSYKHSAIWVRIDHIFHSDDWESYGTYVDKNVDLSDHYPIITHIKRVKKGQ